MLTLLLTLLIIYLLARPPIRLTNEDIPKSLEQFIKGVRYTPFGGYHILLHNLETCWDKNRLSEDLREYVSRCRIRPKIHTREYTYDKHTLLPFRWVNWCTVRTLV